MKKYLLIIFVLFSIKAYTQVKLTNYVVESKRIKLDVELQPDNYGIVKNVGGQQTIQFSNAFNESNPGNYYLPSKIIFIALPSYSEVTVTATPSATERIKGVPAINPKIIMGGDSTLKYISIKSANSVMKKSPVAEISGYLWIRNYYCVSLKINQYQYNNADIIEQINKLHLEIIPEQSTGFANNNDKEKDDYDSTLSSVILNYKYAGALNKSEYYTDPYDTLTNWIDFSKTYLKIGTAKNGVYRIQKNDLTNYGILSSQIDPSTFKLISRGIEIPLLIHYTSGIEWDYLEFFGRRNMGSSDYKQVNKTGRPYNEYLNRYSDTTIYWLTWNGSPGKRIDTMAVTAGIAQDTVTGYTESAHYEQNPWLDYSTQDLVKRQDPEWIENETWVWGQQGVGTMRLPFTVNDVIPNSSATAYYKVQDFASDVNLNAHKIGLSINSDPTVYDSTYINKYQQSVISADISTNLIKSGNNTLNAISYPTAATINSIEYDWYEIDYPRYLKAVNDSLEFRFTNISGSQPKVIKVTSLTGANYILYKFEGGIKRIDNFNISGNTLTFTDSVNNGDGYYLIKEDKILSPRIFYKKNFTDIASDSIQADYILLTYPDFLQEAGKYAAFIEHNYNVKTKVINVFDIYDEFNYGFFAPEPVKYFLESAFNRWKSPKPSYLFLIGDANYDYYSYKVKYFGTPYIPNYVPSYGDPVSDTWFVVWDTTGSLIPQMYVGRIPVNSASEIDEYLQKHKNYLASPYDDWNKRYILISGGDASDPSELDLLKGVNDDIISSIITPSPVAGNYDHFYKTLNPSTNLGPYTNEQISSMFDSGGVAISYIGHSGTQIWDNGITDPQQIGNNRGRFSFVTDFGCSTGKFAEPDIKSFAELFVVGTKSNAIGFIGNSSLGFTSTATTYPQMFYKKLLSSGNLTLGQAHVNAKMQLLSTYGASGVYRVFDLCNTLFADPIIKLKIPDKPNLVINNNNIELGSNSLDGSVDSVKVIVKYFNLGRADSGSFSIGITASLNGVNIFETKFMRSIPPYEDSVSFYLPIKNQVGLHKIAVTLDPDNLVDEIYKTDNNAEIQFNVVSSDLRHLFTNAIDNLSGALLTFLNPSVNPGTDSLVVEIDTSINFSSPVKIYNQLGKFNSQVNLSNLVPGKRYWFRVKLNTYAAQYSMPVSFYYNPVIKQAYLLNDSLSFSNGTMNNIQITGSGLNLSDINKKLVVASAGFYDGGYANINVNGDEYLSDGHLDGPHVAVFDTMLNFLYTKRFDYWSFPSTFEKDFLTFMDTVSSNCIVAFANSGGGGSDLTAKIKAAIKNFGSVDIDSIGFRYSWAMIGRKGAKPGSVPETWSKPFGGAVSVDSNFTFQGTDGNYFTGQFGPVGKWNSLTITSKIGDSSQIKIYPVSLNNNLPDTLASLKLINGTADLSNLKNSNVLRFLVNLSKINLMPNPLLKSLLINYSSLPELGTNYQAVAVSKDSLTIGENESLQFYVYNAGGISADSFNVQVDVVKADNSREKIFESTVDTLNPGGSRLFNVEYNTSSGSGNRSFYITIDPDNKVNELYKDNNIYSIPFYVKGDTSRPSLNITFDGRDILDGEYVSSNPDIKINLNDPTLLPINDTASVNLYLNGSPVYFSNNNDIQYGFSNSNPKLTINYKPKLQGGEYKLSVIAKNALGTYADSINSVKTFLVSNDAHLLYVYNYPNPFKYDTYFTFKLTQIPDEVKIMIYTIAGRLIKTIDLLSGQLHYDFNKIYWSGRDEDGDIIANGIYLYKVIMKKGDKTESTIQKLAIVR